jgi:hypothetical protein
LTSGKWYKKPKKEEPVRLSILYGIALFVFLTAGCSVTYRAGISPILPYLQVNEFQGQGEAISVKNEAREGVAHIENTLPIGDAYYLGEPDIYDYYADLKQVTDVTVSFLVEELSKKGFSVRGDAPKSITLNVTGINLAFMYPYYHCMIEMKYTTSDGFNQAISAYDLSNRYPKACNRAITRGVVDLLNDEELIDFLKSKEK